MIQELTKDQKKLFEKIGVIVPKTIGIQEPKIFYQSHVVVLKIFGLFKEF